MIAKYLARIAGLSNQKVLMSLLIVTGMYYVFGDFGKKASELDSQIQTTQAELEKERAKLKETERLLKKAEMLKGSVDSLNARFAATSKQLPAKISSTEVMRVIDSLAKTAGVSVREKEPLTPIKSGILEQYPIKVVMKGTFSDLLMFIYYISNMEKVSRVSKFTISRQDNGASQIKSGQVNMDITILGYEYIGGEIKHDH